MQDSPTTLKTYQTFNDGQWTDAVSGKRLLTFQCMKADACSCR